MTQRARVRERQTGGERRKQEVYLTHWGVFDGYMRTQEVVIRRNQGCKIIP